MKPIGTPFIQLSEVESTNNYAMAQSQALMAEHGTTWFAWSQTKGKGQRGRSWNATPGENITMSVLLEPKQLQIAQQFSLSVAVSLACYDLFSKYAGDETSIKWPNDIYWRDRKAGGILIENILQGSEWKFAIAGIGININQVRFQAGVQNPVSLKQITGKTFNPVDLAKELCDLLEKRWEQIQQGALDSLLDNYNDHLFMRHQKVSFKQDIAIFEAVVKAVNSVGELIVDAPLETNIPFGSVEWLLPSKTGSH